MVGGVLLNWVRRWIDWFRRLGIDLGVAQSPTGRIPYPVGDWSKLRYIWWYMIYTYLYIIYIFFIYYFYISSFTSPGSPHQIMFLYLPMKTSLSFLSCCHQTTTLPPDIFNCRHISSFYKLAGLLIYIYIYSYANMCIHDDRSEMLFIMHQTRYWVLKINLNLNYYW